MESETIDTPVGEQGENCGSSVSVNLVNLVKKDEGRPLASPHPPLMDKVSGSPAPDAGKAEHVMGEFGSQKHDFQSNAKFLRQCPDT
jgi:hypothetical protein